jgi:hypothetical protein
LILLGIWLSSTSCVKSIDLTQAGGYFATITCVSR